MSLLLNILWLICGGFLAGLGYIIGGLGLCLTVVGIPFGIQSMKLGVATFAPFGKKLVASKDADSTLRVITPNFTAPNAHCYFAWMGDTPIGTGGMYPHQGVVELGGASTLVAYRQQGAQSALIQRRLADAHALGCDLAAVLTSPGSASQRNMQRRGFELAYTRAICVRPLTP